MYNLFCTFKKLRFSIVNMGQNIFVSKPNGLNETQKRFWKQIEDEIERRNLDVRSIGYSDYSFRTPLEQVREVMQDCEGAIILGFKQKYIQHGRDRDQNPVEDEYLPTPWNNLEAGMAYMSDLPLLVIVESGVSKEGIFDAESSDRYILETNLESDWIDADAFTQPFSEWREGVLRSKNNDKGE